MKKERNTVQKTLIKQEVMSTYSHPSADAVYDKIKEVCPSISKATVYRVLNDLAEKGEIYRVKMTDGSDRFDKTLEKHYHIRCSCCGSVSDVDIDYFNGIEDTANKHSDYVVTGHNLIFEGICPDCQVNNN